MGPGERWSDEVIERGVLCSVFLDNGKLDPVSEIVEQGDFSDAQRAAMYGAMLRLRGLGDPIDPITVAAMLPGTNVDAELMAAAEAEATSMYAATYARMLRGRGAIRALAREARVIGEAAASDTSHHVPGEIEAFTRDAVGRLEAINERVSQPEAPALSALIEQALVPSPDQFVSSGIATLDQALGGGFPRGGLSLLAALTSRGKTTLALNVAVSAAMAGYGVMFVSLEMKAHELVQRALSFLSGVNVFSGTRRGFLNGDQQLVGDAKGMLAACAENLSLRYMPGASPSAVRSVARVFARQQGPRLRLVVVDYLGLMKSDRRAERREREVSEAALSLKQLAGELDVACLVLSQFNRQAAEQEKVPVLSMLRESGDLENHADLVLFLHSPRRENEVVDAIVAKARNAALGVTKLRWMREIYRFEDTI